MFERMSNPFERSLAYRLLVAQLQDSADMGDAVLDEIVQYENANVVTVRVLQVFITELADLVEAQHGSRGDAIAALQQLIAQHRAVIDDGL